MMVNFLLLVRGLSVNVADSFSPTPCFVLLARPSLFVVLLVYSAAVSSELIEAIWTIAGLLLPLCETLVFFEYFLMRNIRATPGRSFRSTFLPPQTGAASFLVLFGLRDDD